MLPTSSGPPNTRGPLRIAAGLSVVVSISLLILVGPFGLFPAVLLVPLLLCMQSCAPREVAVVRCTEAGQ